MQFFKNIVHTVQSSTWRRAAIEYMWNKIGETTIMLPNGDKTGFLPCKDKTQESDGKLTPQVMTYTTQ